MSLHPNTALKHLVLAVVVAGLSLPALAHHDRDDDGDAHASHRHWVFTSSNATGANELFVYAASANGSLTLKQRIATGGQGTSAGLGSQGAVTLSGNGRYVFVVNALSNTLSTFEIENDDIRLASVVQSGGLTPISVAEHHGLVYVLNAQGDGNVAGFRNVDGQLEPLTDGLRPLSKAGGVAPAQVGFDADGDVLVVSEKATNLLTSYAVKRDGSLSAPSTTVSAGATPFGFAFDGRDHLLVSEAFGGAAHASAVSSYRLQERPSTQLAVISASVLTQQTAACWLVVTPNSRYAYAANAGSSSLSSYSIQRSGKIALLASVAGTTPAGSHPVDTAVSSDGHALYVLSGGTHTVSAFHVGDDGALSAKSDLDGLPATAVGLAAN